jgi:hypothetical protein
MMKTVMIMATAAVALMSCQQQQVQQEPVKVLPVKK